MWGKIEMNKSNLSDFIVRAQFPEIIEKIRQSDNAVIEASAGTGKTYTLQNLFIELLSGDGVRPGVPAAPASARFYADGCDGRSDASLCHGVRAGS